MPSWLDLLMGGQAPVMPGPPQPQPPFNPQTMVQPPVFAQAPQMAQDVAAGIADPLLKAGNYLGGIMQGSQQFSWPETIQHGAALAMAMAPGPKGERIAGGIERGLAGAAESAAPAGIRAYHGSPHDFPAFDISKIGTGEGAQAYGHGLYFAENEATAKAYREKLAGTAGGSTPQDLMTGLLQSHQGDYEAAANEIRNRIASLQQVAPEYRADLSKTSLPGALKLLEERAPPKGRMYEVNIKAQPEQFLDYEKPIGEQHPTVQQALGKVPGGEYLLNQAKDATGKEALHTITGQLGQDPAATAQALREAGIPGIRYLDQGSRNQVTAINQHLFKPYGGELDLPKPTSNYVVFNDKLIDIMRKYGLAGMLGAGSAAPIFASQGQQQQ